MIRRNRFRGSSRGQFAILAAVIIAAFMLSLMITISQLSTMRQEVSYEPIDEVILTLTSDFERRLAVALANVTKMYLESGDQANAIMCGNKIISDWYGASLELYATYGINVTISPMESKEGSNVDWFIDWGDYRGVSAVYATFGLDAEAYGLKNLAVTLQKALYLQILNSNIISNGSRINVTLDFKVWEGGAKPRYVADLVQSSLEILLDGFGILDSSNVMYFEYMGQGEYRVQLDLDLDELGVKEITSITLIVTVNDIKVAAKLGVCTLYLLSDNLSTENVVDNEGVIIVNGSSFSPPLKLMVLPGQKLNVTFIQPSNTNFVGFFVNGSSVNLESAENSNIAMVNVIGSGIARVIALYEPVTPLSPPTPPEQPTPPAIPSNIAYVNFTSRERDNLNANLGFFIVILPNRTVYIFVDYVRWEFLEEVYEAIKEIKSLLGMEIEDVDLLEVLNDGLFKWAVLPVTNFSVPQNTTLRVIYIPRLGYIARGWETSGSIVVRKSFSLFIFSYMRFTVLGNGTVTAVYDGCRPKEWRVLYISPLEKKASPGSHFTLKLVPELLVSQLTLPLSNPHDKCYGNSIYTTPTILLGKEIEITLYARYTKQGLGSISVKVTLGFYSSNGTFYEIGSDTKTIPKTVAFYPYKFTFKPNVKVIPAGSIITLIIERVDKGSGGTFQVLCDDDTPSRIELW